MEKEIVLDIIDSEHQLVVKEESERLISINSIFFDFVLIDKVNIHKLILALQQFLPKEEGK